MRVRKPCLRPTLLPYAKFINVEVLLTKRNHPVWTPCPFPCMAARGSSYWNARADALLNRMQGLPSVTLSYKPTSNLFPFFIENSPSCKFNYCAVNVKRISFNASKKISKSSTVQACSRPTTSARKHRYSAAQSGLLSVGGLHLSYY